MSVMRMPQQGRSRKTRERILAGVEALLEQHTFEALSVQQIVRRARTCVGSFYHLFGDKDRLLAALYERHAADIHGRLERLLSDAGWAARGLGEGVRLLVGEMIALHERQRGLLRTLVLRGHNSPQRATRDVSGEMREVLPRLAARLADCALGERSAGRVAADEARRASLESSAKVGLLMTLATLREVYLYPQTTAAPAGIGPADLEEPLRNVLQMMVERAAA